MTTMSKLKDHFKNFEKLFDSQIFNKKEYSSLMSSYSDGYKRNPNSNIENDFIRVYILNDGSSLGFGFNNIELKKNKQIEFYENLFNEVLSNDKKYNSIKEYIQKDINDLLNETKILYNSKFDRIKPFGDFNSNNVKKIAQELIKEELITLTYYDKTKTNVYSKVFNFTDFKEEFKKFKFIDILKQDTIISLFNLISQDIKLSEQQNAFDEFKFKYNDKLVNLLDLKDNVKHYTKDFEETSKICDKLIQEFSQKIYKQYDYANKRDILNNEKNKLSKQEQEFFGYYSNKGLIEDFYYETNSTHNIGLNQFKKNLETEIKNLDKSSLNIDNSLDFNR